MEELVFFFFSIFLAFVIFIYWCIRTLKKVLREQRTIRKYSVKLRKAQEFETKISNTISIVENLSKYTNIEKNKLLIIEINKLTDELRLELNIENKEKIFQKLRKYLVRIIPSLKM